MFYSKDFPNQEKYEEWHTQQIEQRREAYKIAMAAGQDAGNRNAAANGRNEWNEDDWNVAAETTARLLEP